MDSVITYKTLKKLLKLKLELVQDSIYQGIRCRPCLLYHQVVLQVQTIQEFLDHQVDRQDLLVQVHLEIHLHHCLLEDQGTRVVREVREDQVHLYRPLHSDF